MSILLQLTHKFRHTHFVKFIRTHTRTHRISLVPVASSAIKMIRSFLGSSTDSPEGYLLRQRLNKACSSLDLLDLNYALYRCDAEERDDGEGGGAYEVPGAGQLVYCGLQGIMSMMNWVRDNNDLGHPLCDNLRAGDWMAGYMTNRLKLKPETKQVGSWGWKMCPSLS